MIVDVIRNDAARVATTGSIAVTALCRAERYPTVHQLTSEGDRDAAAGNRAGAVSTVVRSAWCPRGHVRCARFDVAIRAAVVDTDTASTTYGTGGGITWDSEPAAEYAELLAKAVPASPAALGEPASTARSFVAVNSAPMPEVRPASRGLY
ncbi:chorismate-binding protein [Prauserella muralis]|uniref:Chorismate-utilising enzyme C-terminal domain-containing protein n=1 Tax=Prauserella muralis TaxID=588067 RepID=A0A2V4APS5_9PSEU|nr:chorismate-binding protein [Prauserella muralis]PXY22706.1 hypothetical protein BAY60_23115 [Prauserella muralis]